MEQSESVSFEGVHDRLKWKSCKAFLPQILATLSATVGSFGLGTVLGWTSPALPSLKESLDLGDLSSNELTWIASLAILGALTSGPPTGYLASKIGRRSVMLLYSIPFAFGWALIAAAMQFPQTIYYGRFITGFFGGAFTVVIPIYVSEISDDSLRGVLGSCMVLMLVSGILFTFIAGTFLSWFWLAVVCGIFPILGFISMLVCPESPRFLLMKGRNEDARKAFRWLQRHDSVHTEIEFSKLERTVNVSNDSSPGSRSHVKPFSLPVIKPALICLLLMSFQQLGGINSVTMYTVEIFQSTGPHIDPNRASIVIGIVQVVFVLLSMFLVDKLGRKIILIGSSFMMAVNLAVLGYFFRVKESSVDGQVPDSLSWIPMVTLVGFIIAYSFGMGPIPWLLSSELLSPHYKGQTQAVVTLTYWVLAFVATKTFQDMIDALNESGCYWVFAAVCLGGSLFTLFVIPETKNKSPEEIQRYFGAKDVPPEDLGCDSIEALDANKISTSTISVKIDDNRNLAKKKGLLLNAENDDTNDSSDDAYTYIDEYTAGR